MNNPNAIQIHCDGAMDYDSRQTGGNGFIIEFPDSFKIDPIVGSIRNDNQGIHRLELISLVEAMESLLIFARQNSTLIRDAGGVEIYTDRFSATDELLTNPYKIKSWRKNGWKNHEEKEIKDRDILDKIDKTRIKLSKAVGGYVEISHKRRKENKTADKLSKKGKKSLNRGVKIFEPKKRRFIKRLYEGSEVNYSAVNSGLEFEVRVYAWEPVGKRFEVCFEVCSGDFEGCIIKAYISEDFKLKLHRGHFYLIRIDSVFNHHVEIELLCTDIR
ncbi:RNase H family protein [Patescibacteria group bacterium]